MRWYLLRRQKVFVFRILLFGMTLQYRKPLQWSSQPKHSSHRATRFDIFTIKAKLKYISWCEIFIHLPVSHFRRLITINFIAVRAHRFKLDFHRKFIQIKLSQAVSNKFMMWHQNVDHGNILSFENRRKPDRVLISLELKLRRKKIKVAISSQRKRKRKSAKHFLDEVKKQKSYDGHVVGDDEFGSSSHITRTDNELSRRAEMV